MLLDIAVSLRVRLGTGRAAPNGETPKLAPPQVRDDARGLELDTRIAAVSFRGLNE
jgi:hypothetical protein